MMLRSNESTALIAESTFVALESLKNAMPRTEPTYSIRCSTPRNSRTTSASVAPETEYLLVIAIDASTFSMLCSPRRSTSEADITACPLRYSMPPKRNAPSATPSVRLKKCCRARMPSGGGKTFESSRLSTAISVSFWFSKMRNFELAIGFEVRVSIEMIRRDVQQRRHMRAKLHDGVQLKTADFDHIDRGGRRGVHQSAHRRSDVSANLNRLACGLKNLSNQSGRRGLAVRSCDRDDVALQISGRQFEFADDGNTFRARRCQRWNVQRHTRADDNFICLEKAFDSVLTRFPRNPEASSSPDAAGFPESVTNTDFPRLLKEPCRRNTTSCHTHHNNHLNFNVDRLNNAKINATIQNRMMTFDSVHPISSK